MPILEVIGSTVGILMHPNKTMAYALLRRNSMASIIEVISFMDCSPISCRYSHTRVARNIFKQYGGLPDKCFPVGRQAVCQMHALRRKLMVHWLTKNSPKEKGKDQLKMVNLMNHRSLWTCYHCSQQL